MSLPSFVGNTYGASTSGGQNSFGNIFSVEIETGKRNVIHNFKREQGYQVQKQIVVDQVLYGIHKRGGSHDLGTLYSYATSSQNFQVLYNFDQNDRYPIDLINMNGKLLILTMGKQASGVIAQYDLSTKQVNHLTFSEWKSPSQMFAQDQKIYIVAETTSAKSAAIFTYNTTTSDLQKTVTIPRVPGLLNDVLQMNHELFYAISYYGGKNKIGSLYKWDLKENSFTTILDFEDQNPISLVSIDNQLLINTKKYGSSEPAAISMYDAVSNQLQLIYSQKR